MSKLKNVFFQFLFGSAERFKCQEVRFQTPESNGTDSVTWKSSTQDERWHGLISRLGEARISCAVAGHDSNGEALDSSQATILTVEECADDTTEDSRSGDSQPHIESHEASHLPFYHSVGENIDFEVKTKDMTLSNWNRTLHWSTMAAVDEQIGLSEKLRNDRPRCSIMTVNETAFLPSQLEVQQIRD